MVCDFSIDDLEVVDLLLRYGAERENVDGAGQSYNDFAKKSAGRDIQERLRRREANIETPDSMLQGRGKFVRKMQEALREKNWEK